jgi:hypothetical protein
VELSPTTSMDVDVDGIPVGFEVLNATPATFADLSARSDSITLKDLMAPVEPGIDG